MTLFWCLYYKLWTYFTPLFKCFCSWYWTGNCCLGFVVISLAVKHMFHIINVNTWLRYWMSYWMCAKLVIKKQRKMLIHSCRYEGICEVHTQARGGGVRPEAHLYCFSDVIILLQCVQGGSGGQIFGLFERTYFVDGPYVVPVT